MTHCILSWVEQFVFPSRFSESSFIAIAGTVTVVRRVHKSSRNANYQLRYVHLCLSCSLGGFALYFTFETFIKMCGEIQIS